MRRSTTLSLAPKLVRLEWIRCRINWGTENWQNLNRHALANLGPFCYNYKYVKTVGACIFIVNIM